MNRRSGRVVVCSLSEARARRGQARAFLEAAEAVFGEAPREAHVAAALAVLSGIAASDAICGLALRRWSRGSDHGQALELLRTVAGLEGGLVVSLKRLLDQKDAVHYSPDLVTADRAQGMLRQARALVEAAEKLGAVTRSSTEGRE